MNSISEACGSSFSASLVRDARFCSILLLRSLLPGAHFRLATVRNGIRGDDNSSHFGRNLTSSWLVLPDSFGLIQALWGHSAWRGRKHPFSGRLIAIVKLKPIPRSSYYFKMWEVGVNQLRSGSTV
jgi:hypothetical protein